MRRFFRLAVTWATTLAVAGCALAFPAPGVCAVPVAAAAGNSTVVASTAGSTLVAPVASTLAAKSAGAVRSAGAKSLHERLSAISGFRPFMKVSPAITKALGNKALLKYQVKIAVLLALARTARYCMQERAKQKLASVQDGGDDPEFQAALAPLFDLDTIGSYFAEMVEYQLLFSAGGAFEKALTANFPTGRVPQRLMIKTASYGAVFAAWAVANGLTAQIREGRWRGGLTREVMLDLVNRVGEELIYSVGAMLAVQTVCFLGKLAWHALAGYLAGTVVESMAARVALVAGKILTGLNIAGLVIAAVILLAPLIKRGIEAMNNAEYRANAGAQLLWRNQLEDLIGAQLAKDGGKLLRNWSPQYAATALNGYASGSKQVYKMYESKAEIFAHWAVLNNSKAEETCNKIREKYGDIQKEMERPQYRAALVAALKRDIEELRGDLRGVFSKRGAKPGFFGTTEVGELEAIEAELARLQGVTVADDNTRSIEGATAKRVQDLAALGRLQSRVLPGSSFMALPYGKEPAAGDVESAVQNFFGDAQDEMLVLKGFLIERRAAILDFQRGPTEEEARVEEALFKEIFLALRELTEEAKQAGRRRQGEAAPTMSGLNGR